VTIYERALELVPDGAVIGLGSGRAAWAFVRLLGERVRSGRLSVRGVPTSDETARIAAESGVSLVSLGDAGELAVTVDGADEVDPHLDLIKGYGRALVREKVVAASSRQLVILVGEEKRVPQLGSRGRLPIEVVPFAVPLCQRRLAKFGLRPVLWEDGGRPSLTDNGNQIFDCGTDPIPYAALLEADLRAIPGVVGTGLFVGMADVVLVGDDRDFRLTREERRDSSPTPRPKEKPQ
jgi:ribose 5-phosphate isomerase A